MGGSDPGGHAEQVIPVKGGICFYSFCCLSEGLGGGQNPDVCHRKQGGPPTAACRGKLCRHAAGREVSQGVFLIPSAIKMFRDPPSPPPKSKYTECCQV